MADVYDFSYPDNSSNRTEMTDLSRLQRQNFPATSASTEQTNVQKKKTKYKKRKDDKGSVGSRGSSKSGTSTDGPQSINTGSDEKTIQIAMIDKLYQWMTFRTKVNGHLSDDILSQKFHQAPAMADREDILKKPSVYRYGITDDQATSLDESEFVNFGIPRAAATFFVVDENPDYDK